MAIPLESLSATLGSALGRGVAQPVGQALDFLMQNKMQNILNQQALAQQQSLQQAQQQKLSSALSAFNVSPQIASAISLLPAELQKTALQNLPVLQQLSQGAPEYQVAPTPLPQVQPEPQRKPLRDIGRPEPLTSIDRMNEFIRRQSGLPPVTPLSSALSQQQMQEQEQVAPRATVLPQAVPQMGTTPAQPIRPSIADAFISPAERRQREMLDIQRERLRTQQAQLERKIASQEAREAKKIKAAEEKEATKETKKFYDQTLEIDKANKEGEMTLKRMTKLIDKGNLPPAAFYKLVKDIQENVPSTHGAAVGGLAGGYFAGPVGAALGATIGGIISPIAGLIESGIKNVFPDAEEFEKLSNSFIKQAKPIFGARLTDQDLKTFLATIPTLTQTEQGKRKIIRNMEIAAKAGSVRADAMKKIIKENKGKRPFDLPLQVEERVEPELNRLAQEFIS